MLRRSDGNSDGALHELGQQLSPKAGLHVEFKIDSLSRMRRSPVSIFTHDLVASHRLLFGEEGIFDSCEHHLQSEDIPLSEASHLLLNRCSGLLLAREILLDADRFAALAPEQTDFVGRNLAKAQLCLGDAILVAFRRHHWSCTQRHLRLHHLVVPEPLPWLEERVKFKLHPRQILKSPSEFEQERRALCSLALDVWLWLENQRLGCNFSSVRDYAFYPRPKCPGASWWRNYSLNLRTFGAKAALAPLSWRYPRERLFNALALLLWNGEASQEPEIVRHLQRQLSTRLAGFCRRVQTGLASIWLKSLEL